MDYDSDGVSCDRSSASHQNGCESRRGAARGYILVVTIFRVGLEVNVARHTLITAHCLGEASPDVLT